MISPQDKLAAESFDAETTGSAQVAAVAPLKPELPDTNLAIALPVRAYQMRNSTLWNIRAADGQRLAVELSETSAREIEIALNERQSLRGVVQCDPNVRSIECCVVMHRCGHIRTWPALPYSNAVKMTKRLCPDCALTLKV